MYARIMFDTPEDMAVGKAELIRQGFRVEVLDTFDPGDLDEEGGPYVWVRAYINVDYDDQERFDDWVRGLGVGGDVIEAGLSPFEKMVSFATWQKFVEASSGSAAMKRRVIDFVCDRVREGELIDSFVLGLTLGGVSRKLSEEQLRDFEATILLTRDLNNVPIVQVDGQPVS
jgi:hypothetical protein